MINKLYKEIQIQKTRSAGGQSIQGVGSAAHQEILLVRRVVWQKGSVAGPSP